MSNTTRTRKAWVYILQCRDGSLYTGWCYNIVQRLAKHRSGAGSKYVYSRLPFILMYSKELPNKSAAMKREAAIKKLTHKEKMQLCLSGKSS